HVLLAEGKLERGLESLQAKRRHDTENAVNRVQLMPRSRYAMRVEPAGSLASVGHADANPRPRRGGHQAGTQESLQVDRQVVFLAQKPGAKLRCGRRPARRDPRTTPFIGNDPIQVRTTVEQVSKCGIHHPANLGGWE